MGAALVGLVLAHACPARADTELGTGILAGLAGVGEGNDVWEHSRFALGVRADVLGGRSGPGGLAGGGFVAATTAGFRGVRLAGGAEALLPLRRAWTAVVSAGPMAHFARGAWAPGATSWVFLGQRSFNYHGRYGMAWGVVAGYERDLTATGSSAVVLGVQVDGLVVALPLMFGFEAMRRRGNR